MEENIGSPFDHSLCPNEKYLEAVEKGTWANLVPWPCLMFRWGMHHPEDWIKIATVASHRLKKHAHCQTPEKCSTVEKFIHNHLPGQKNIWNK